MNFGKTRLVDLIADGPEEKAHERALAAMQLVATDVGKLLTKKYPYAIDVPFIATALRLCADAVMDGKTEEAQKLCNEMYEIISAKDIGDTNEKD